MLCAVVLIVLVRKYLNLDFCEILCLGGGMQQFLIPWQKYKNSMILRLNALTVTCNNMYFDNVYFNH